MNTKLFGVLCLAGSVLFSAAIFAATEVVCAKHGESSVITRNPGLTLADESAINTRIKQLEGTGKIVKVTSLAVSSSAAYETSWNVWIDKTCVVLEY